MKICFCSHCDGAAGPAEERLRAAGCEVGRGDEECLVWAVAPPPEPERAVEYVARLREAAGPEPLLLVCGGARGPEETAALLAAGADEILNTSTETREVVARLRVVEKRLQREGRTVEARLRWLKQKALERLARALFHDYNNHLAAIQGNAELALMEHGVNGGLRHGLGQIAESARAASQLTRQVLLLAGGDGTRAVALGAALREMEPLLRVAAPRGCRVELQVAPGLPAVRAEIGPLRLALVELLGRTGGPVARISVSAAERGVRLRVSGCTADPNDGWAAVAGTIGASLTAGPAEVEWTFEAELSGSEPAAAPQGVAATVLLIDDEEGVRLAAQRLLRRAGYTLLEAADGEEGVELFRQVGPSIDLVLLDLNLPGMSAGRVIAELRRLRAGVRIVIWSGHEEEYAREQLVGINGLRFLEKPANLSALASLLAPLLAD